LHGFSAAHYQADHEEQDNRASDGDQQAGKVEARDALCAEEAHDPAADKCADDADHDVGDGAHLLVLPHDDTCDPSSECAEDDPYEPVHIYLHEKLDFA
jgi:hypothetical protein